MKTAGPGRKRNQFDYGEGGIYVSLHQFLLETGKDRPSVEKKLQRAGVKPINGPRNVLLYRLRDLLAVALYTGNADKLSVDRLDPFRRKAHYQAELGKMKLHQEACMLVQARDAQAEEERVRGVVDKFLTTLPAMLQRDCGGSAAVLQVIEKHTQAVRRGINGSMSRGDEC